MEMIQAASLNNEGLKLEQAGQYPAAEAKYLRALELKTQSSEAMPVHRALTQNCLGELYLKMNRLDEAQEMLELALVGRAVNANFDQACTRDNLGRLYETRGDLVKAREYRLMGAPNEMVCSYFQCQKSARLQFAKRDELRKCARCASAFYCDRKCQKADWKRHKEHCEAVEA